MKQKVLIFIAKFKHWGIIYY